MLRDLLARETETLALARASKSKRLVLLTGPPGIGKSALAAAFAKPSRPVVCQLEGARDGIEILDELVRALGLPATAAADANALTERIHRALVTQRETLIVLDDVDRCRVALAKLLRKWLANTHTPGVRFLVTARGRLGVPGEHVFEVGPLDVPSKGETDPEIIAASPAVQLFARRAASVRPGFRISAANARTVKTIVRELDGVPLAIELCASRLRALSEKDIADLLAERLDLLEDERGERSIRSAFTLSWDELAAEDARLFAACSCFRGGFLLDAACAVAAEGVKPGPKERLRVARGLERLVEGSLVRVGEGDERRYALSETLRVFAAEKLAAREDAAALEERHARHYASLRTHASALPIDVLATERKNLERAFDTSLSAGHPRAATALLSYAPVALARGPLAPFLERVSRALTEISPSPSDRAELLFSRGLARIYQGHRDDAVEDLEQARVEARLSGVKSLEALATSKLAIVKGLKGDLDEALALLDNARRAARASSEDRTQGIVLKDLANVLAEAGRNDDAVVALGRARKFLRAAGDIREEGFVAMMLASRFVDDGRLALARRDLDTALTQLRRAGDVRSEAWALTLLALVEAEEGSTSKARAHLEKSLSLVRDVGNQHTEGLVLGYLGSVALEQGLLPDAESAYRDAIVCLSRAGDQASEGFFTATSAVVDYLLGRAPAARDGFARARSLVKDDARAARREAVDLLATIGRPGQRQAKNESALPAVEEIRFARRVLAAVAARDTSTSTTRTSVGMVVANDGSWVRMESGRIAKLGKGRPIARVMARLALERVRHPGRPLPLQSLVRAGWPDERVLPAAAKNRVHVTIARLRRVALDCTVIHEDDGYFLDPKAEARLADPGEPPA